MANTEKTIKHNEIETNLTRIRTLSRKKERENWEFRDFLKRKCPSERLDFLLHRLYQDISAAIDCTTCGNCCQEILPVQDEEDIERFAQGLGISPKELTDQFLVRDEEGFTFNHTPCPFQREKGCTNYEARPKDCRSYPHLHKENTISRLMGVVKNYSICPIVFNVYEALKRELWSRSRPR